MSYYSEGFFFLMASIYTVVMDDGDDANELESFPTHNEALDYLKQQVHDWNHTDKWDKIKKRLAMIIAENGLELDSYGFAKKISLWRDNGNQAVILIIGGASGLSKGVKEKADLSISLGKIVWPHRLVRVMLAEQLYRAASIISRSPYHKA